MFTGIVKGIGTINNIIEHPGLRQISILMPPNTTELLEIGASIAVDGVCLTVTRFTDKQVTFDVMSETLVKTTLGSFKLGQHVNIERAAKSNTEIGGHLISGHVDCTCIIKDIKQPQNNYVITFEVESNINKYIFSKGFIALNGASLTIAATKHNTFEVWLIPETLRLTTFAEKVIGDKINLEIDRNTQVIVDTVTRYLEHTFPRKDNI